MARLKVSVDKTIADNITKDPGKDILYKLLDKLAPQPTKSTGSEKEPKVAAMQPANGFTNDLSAKFRKLRAELRRELREEMRSLRESLICPQESQESQFSPVFSPHRWEQNASGSSFSPRPPPHSFKDGRTRDGRPTCYRCGKTVHMARNCVLKMSTFRKTLMSRELLQTKTYFFIPRR